MKVRIIFYPSRVSGEVRKGVSILEAARSLGVDIEGPCGGTGKCGKDLVQIRKEGNLHTVLACKTPVETDLEVICRQHEKKSLKIIEGFHAAGNKTYGIAPSVKKELVHDKQGICSTRVYDTGNLLLQENGDTTNHIYGIALDIGTTTLVASLVDLRSGEILGSSSSLNPLVHYGHDVMSRIRYSAAQKDGLRSMHRELISAVHFLIQVLSSERDVKPEHIYQIIGAGNTTMQHIFLNKEIKGIGEYPYQAETLDVATMKAQELSLDIAINAPVMTFPCISAYVGGDIVSGLLAIDIKSLEAPALFLDIGTNGEIALILNDTIIASSTAAGPCFEGMTISSGMRAGEGAIEHVGFEEEISLEVISGGQPRGICGSGLLDLVSELVGSGIVNARGRLQSPDNKNNTAQQTVTTPLLPGDNSVNECTLSTSPSKSVLSSPHSISLPSSSNTVSRLSGSNLVPPLSSANVVHPLSSSKVIPPIKGGEGGCKDRGTNENLLYSNAMNYRKNLFEKNGKRHFRLTDTVSISQEDIRQVQLAKAAIRAGVEILLARCNLTAEELKTIIIAGGFGYHLNEKSIFGIGLLPETKNAKISFVGNSSLEGAVKVLLNKKLVNEAVQIARTAQVVELSQIPEFESVFIREMHF